MKLPQIIRKVFLNSTGSILLLNSTFGSSITTNTTADSEVYATPQRTTEAEERMKTLALTEGQKVAQKQAEVLTYQRLLAVFGDSFLSLIKKQFGDINHADLEVHWNSTFDPTHPYNDSKKRNILRKIPDLIQHYSGERTAQYLLLSDDITRLEIQTKKVPLTRIEESTRGYFDLIFPGSTITTSWKRGGDQLGCVAEVTFADGKVLTYFVKTHSGGLRSGHSSAAKLVNPAELLVYKVLEGLGVGPQSHFFGGDGQNLYIATLDVGTEVNSDGSLTQTPFKEYEYFKTSQDPTVIERLWGALSQLPPDVEFSEEQHLKAEQWLKSDPRSCMFVHEMSKLDLLARMLWLTDFQTNPGNYGFIQGQEGQTLAKAIDFRLAEVTQIDQYKCSQGSFESFLSGNGLYHYISADKVTCYALRHRQQHLRVLEANSIIDRELRNFEETVNLATRHVLNALDGVIMTDTERTRTQKDLAQYSEIIKSNFRFFREQLASLK